MKKVIGLTGGVGSGKSRVLNILNEEFGACVIQADEVAKRLEEPGQEGYKKIIEALGTGFLDENGSIDRGKLADLIFKDKGALGTIKSIIHPLVWNEIQNEIRTASEPLVVVEAALLAKNGDDIYDELWYVYTSRDNRIRRLLENRGYSREKSESIMDNQPSDQLFFELSDRVIDNNGTLDDLRRQLREILE